MLTLLYAAAVFLVPRPAEVIINATVPTVAALSVLGRKKEKKKQQFWVFEQSGKQHSETGRRICNALGEVKCVLFHRTEGGVLPVWVGFSVGIYLSAHR